LSQKSPYFCDIFPKPKQTIAERNTFPRRILFMGDNNKPNPDDRSDNVEILQSMIHNTIENMEAAEESLSFTESEQQREAIAAKNERRRESIDSFRSEIKDEAQNNQR
jgi:small acid-soluble spore protein (thioredoxin-like protein)